MYVSSSALFTCVWISDADADVDITSTVCVNCSHRPPTVIELCAPPPHPAFDMPGEVAGLDPEVQVPASANAAQPADTAGLAANNPEIGYAGDTSMSKCVPCPESVPYSYCPHCAVVATCFV